VGECLLLLSTLAGPEVCFADDIACLNGQIQLEACLDELDVNAATVLQLQVCNDGFTDCRAENDCI
jgi:hypothetical protein